MAPLFICSLVACRPERSSSPKNIFGLDSRDSAKPNEYPYTAIGRIETGCTASLIGKNLAVTAAHCVYDLSAHKVPSALGYLNLSLTAGKPRDKAWIKRIWFGTDDADENRGKDWAILLLDGNPGERNRWLSPQKVDFSGKLPYSVSLAGYSIDKDQGRSASVHRGCYIFTIKGERLLHECDAAAGISGAPMYVMNGTSASVVALSVSEYRQGAAQSTHPDNWSEDNANVAIATTAFYDTYVKIQRAIDLGTALPTLDGVLEEANPNVPEPASGGGTGIDSGNSGGNSGGNSDGNSGNGTPPECQVPDGVDPSTIYPPLPSYC